MDIDGGESRVDELETLMSTFIKESGKIATRLLEVERDLEGTTQALSSTSSELGAVDHRLSTSISDLQKAVRDLNSLVKSLWEYTVANLKAHQELLAELQETTKAHKELLPELQQAIQDLKGK